MNDEDLTRQLQELGKYTPDAPAHLVPRVLANLPPASFLDRIVSWFADALWRGAAAAAMPLLVGFMIGLSAPADSAGDWYDVEDLVYVDALEDFDYEDI